MMKVSMSKASAASKLSFIVVLLLSFSYHVFLSSAIYIEPPFSPEKHESIFKYAIAPAPIFDIMEKLRARNSTFANKTDEIDERIPINSTSDPILQDEYSYNPIRNGTFAIIPIAYELARSIIPKRYGILNAGIRRFLPDFPQDKYPLFLSTGMQQVRTFHDESVSYAKLESDGSSMSNGTEKIYITSSAFSYAEFRFPFVDLLGDGHSHFSYVRSTIISKPHDIYEVFGQKTNVATFQPSDAPYALVPGDKAKERGEYFFNAHESDDSFLNTTFAPTPAPRSFISPYPLSLYANITNQPAFACTSADCVFSCHMQMTFFLTPVSLGELAPINVNGSVSYQDLSALGNGKFHWEKWDFKSVHGIKVAVKYMDIGFKYCDVFKGYMYEDSV